MTAEVDASTASALGFPKLKYVFVERERRWLCREVPAALIRRSERITDLYVARTRLRLREAQPLDGGPAKRRLGRKADVDAATRLITSIYLAPEEFALFVGLPGRRFTKVRHQLGPVNGVEMSVDVFEGELAGLVMAEAEFESAEAMAAYPSPDFAVREVTDDPRYGGGWLVENGLPEAA